MRQTKSLSLTSVVPISASLCRLSSVPAGRWPFPTLSLQSLRRCLDPYPQCPPGAFARFFPEDNGLTSDVTSSAHQTIPAMQLQQGGLFRGCSHSLMFRLPRSIGPQVAPTAEVLSLQGGQAVYTTHSSVGYLPRDVASLRVRYERLTRLDFHQLDCSLVGCSGVPIPMFTFIRKDYIKLLICLYCHSLILYMIIQKVINATSISLSLFTKEDYFLNFFLNPARPTRPDPKRSIVAGSGIGSGPVEFTSSIQFRVPPGKGVPSTLTFTNI